MRTEVLNLSSAQSAPYRIRLGIPATPPPSGGWPAITMLGADAFDAGCALIRYHADCRPPGYVDAGVLIGVDYPEGDNRRRLDYTPPQADVGGRTDAACPPDAAQGGGAVFLDFLLQTLRPHLQRRLPLDPARQALAGHSLGGLFTLHALRTRPDAFQTYIASSPSVWWGDRYLEAMAAAWRQDAMAQARRQDAGTPPAGVARQVCISVGEYEQAVSPLERRQPDRDLEHLAATRTQRAMIDGNRAVAALLSDIPSLDVTFHVQPGHYHRSVWPSALNLGILAALRNA